MERVQQRESTGAVQTLHIGPLNPDSFRPVGQSPKSILRRGGGGDGDARRAGSIPVTQASITLLLRLWHRMLKSTHRAFADI